jgi:hypothetical protein
MPLAADLFDTVRFREQERATGGIFIAKTIEWMVEPEARGGFLISAASFNADNEVLDHRQWTVEKVGDALTHIADWKRELQLSQSQHAILIKRVTA